ncbi:MAG: polyprenyl synthetase family protein [Clostridia bacterium]|nr:polyprenyl synthetase family protein [Clostridia bacterium]
MSGMYGEQMQRHLQKIEEYLPSCMPQADPLCAQAVQAMAYACEAGGKRIRPVLTMEFCRLCGQAPDKALPFAAAIELIHSYSLVHDDLPCMDNSPLRRGKPSVHAAFGETTALLAGDALLNRAFEIALDPARHPDVTPERVCAAVFVLGTASGMIGMVGGQVLDLYSENRLIDLDVLERLQLGKTAALLTAACEMGVLVAGGTPEQREAARTYGREIGLAFQMIDDVLDVTATQEELGKPVSSDAANHKSTYVTLLGVEKTRQLAAERTCRAVEALTVFGEQAQELRGLAQALLYRTK